MYLFICMHVSYAFYLEYTHCWLKTIEIGVPYHNDCVFICYNIISYF